MIVHADWSKDKRKRWMALAAPDGSGWNLSVEPVGDLATLLDRLTAQGDSVVLGLDLPIGLPIALGEHQPLGACSFPELLGRLEPGSPFLTVTQDLAEVSPDRPFYPARPLLGMSRRAYSEALGIPWEKLFRTCDRRTATRNAAAAVTWTLGGNQVGKAAISAWMELLVPARDRIALWPFEGSLNELRRPGRVVVAETYPAEAPSQLGIRPINGKRRQDRREEAAGALKSVMARLEARPDAKLLKCVEEGFGLRKSAEDPFDALLGLLCMLQVIRGERPEAPPLTPDMLSWEGWILGQALSPDTAPPPAPGPA